MIQYQFNVTQLSDTYIQTEQINIEFDDFSGERIGELVVAKQIFPIKSINLTTTSEFDEKNNIVFTGANFITNNMNGFAFPAWNDVTFIDRDGNEQQKRLESLFFGVDGMQYAFHDWMIEMTKILL